MPLAGRRYALWFTSSMAAATAACLARLLHMLWLHPHFTLELRTLRVSA